MEIIFNRDDFNKERFTGVGLGTFDGLHKGHMTLIDTLIEQSGLNGLDSILYTFRNHPENIIRNGVCTTLLTTERKKKEILSGTALDYLFLESFDEDFLHIEPVDFVKKILIEKFRMKLAVVGFNYRFGYKGLGDVSLLEKLGRECNFNVVVIPPVVIDNEVISSTLVRNYISKGEIDKAYNLLGRYYSIDGTVEQGKKLGSKLGFPTANIYPDELVTLPQKGVYITRTFIDKKKYSSITNIGVNPTFEGSQQVKLETHILDFSRNVYNRNIEVFFIKKIRDEKRFSSKDELVKQVKRDTAIAREYFEKT